MWLCNIWIYLIYLWSIWLNAPNHSLELLRIGLSPPQGILIEIRSERFCGIGHSSSENMAVPRNVPQCAQYISVPHISCVWATSKPERHNAAKCVTVGHWVMLLLPCWRSLSVCLWAPETTELSTTCSHRHGLWSRDAKEAYQRSRNPKAVDWICSRFIMIYYDLFHFNLFPPFSAKWSQISQFEKLSVRFPQALITDKYRNEFDYTSCRLNCGTSKRMQKVWCATHDCSTLHVFDKYTNCTNPLCSSHPVAELLHASWSGDEKGFPASGRFPPSLCANYLQLTTEGGI